MSLKKIVAVIMSCVMLGQSALFAQSSKPSSLAQYQKQALADVQFLGMELNDMELMAISMVAFGSIALIRIQIQLESEAKQIKSVIETETAELRALKAKAGESARLEAEIIQKTINDLKQKLIKVENNIFTLKAVTGAYGLTVLKRDKVSPELKAKIKDKMNKYEALLDKNLSQAEKKSLINEFLQDAEFALSDEEKVEVGAFLRRQILIGDKIMFKPALEGLIKGFLRSPGFYVLGGIIVLSMFAQDAHAQKVANRVVNNPDLFLKATPQQLEKLETDDSTREACITMAEAIHTLTHLTPEQLVSYKQILIEQQQKETRTNRMQQNRSRGLAY